MANRPVFKTSHDIPFVSEVNTEFEFHPGFSIQQKQRSITSLHESFLQNYPGLRVLEISSKSNFELGVRLSAFNLIIHQPGVGDYSVESAFQASKVFELGGPFQDLLRVSSRDAKRDSRLRSSGQLLGFKFFSREFPLEPKTYFYDWLYASTLWRKQELLREVVQFEAFTDIEYNPKKSVNCQARSVAKVVGLWRRNLLAAALETPEKFLTVGYPECQEESAGDTADEARQDSLF